MKKKTKTKNKRNKCSGGETPLKKQQPWIEGEKIHTKKNGTETHKQKNKFNRKRMKHTQTQQRYLKMSRVFYRKRRIDWLLNSLNIKLYSKKEDMDPCL